MAGDRAALNDPYFTDGSPRPTWSSSATVRRCTHASVWRDSDVGAAIDAVDDADRDRLGRDRARGRHDRSPRWCADDGTGLSHRCGAVSSRRATSRWRVRDRYSLSDVALVTLGATGIVHHDDNGWRVVAGDVVVTRGQDDANSLGLGDRHRLDDDVLAGLARRRADGVDRLDDVKTLHDLAEQRVERREADAVGTGDDEEL